MLLVVVLVLKVILLVVSFYILVLKEWVIIKGVKKVVGFIKIMMIINKMISFLINIFFFK